MASITINGSIVIEDNASGDADFPGKVLKLTSGVFVETNADEIVVSDIIVVPGGEVVDVASVA